MFARNTLCALALLLASPPAALADKPKSTQDDTANTKAQAKREAARRKAEARRKAAQRRKAEARRKAAERRKAEAKRKEAERRKAEAKRKEAERRKVEAKRKEVERRKAEAKRKEAQAQREQAAREKAEAQKARLAAKRIAAAKKTEAKRRARAEQVAEQRRTQAAHARRADQLRRAQEARKRDAARREADSRRQSEARKAREAETERRAIEARMLEAARRDADAQRRADAERRAIEASKLEASRREAEAQRQAEAERARQIEAARLVESTRLAEAARLAEAERARQLEAERLAEAARRLEAERAAKPIEIPTVAGDDGGARLAGSRTPGRRHSPPMRPIPKPTGPDEAVPTPPPVAEGGPDEAHPTPPPVAGGEPGESAPTPPVVGRRPVRRPGARPDGPRRGDRRSPGDSRADWDRTTDRVGDAARPRAPGPVRRPRSGTGYTYNRPAAPGPADRRAARRAERRADPRYDRPPAPAPIAEPDAYAGGGPIGERQQGLSAAGPQSAPQRIGPGPALPIPTAETRSETDWFEGFTARGAFGDWRYQPLSDQAAPFGGGTTERYTVEALDLYRVDAILDTRWARLQARYESNRGFSIGRDGYLVDLMLGFGAVSGLDGLEISYQALDFDHGRVDLLDVDSGQVLETARLRVDLSTLDVGYALTDNVKVFGRKFDSVAPRNVYLEQAGVTSQVSEQLLEVDATAWAGGLTVAHADDGDGLFGGVGGWFGFGPYDIRTLSGGAFLDGGWLTAGGIEAHVGYRLPLAHGFSVGVRDTFSVLRLSPDGLPTGMERDLADAGVDTEGLGLDFGTVELLNGLHVDLTWSI